MTVPESEVADLLRLCEFAMGRAETAMMAFVDSRYLDGIRRDHERLREVRQMVASMLTRLPPEEPLTEDRLEIVGRVVGAALRKRFGEGTAEQLDQAIEDAWPCTPDAH